MSDSRFFYRDLEILPTFADAANSKRHQPLPEDWWLVITDVVGSTAAIQDGRYKDVNTVGAATIMAVINVDRSIEIPFVFGGDGATLAVPPCMVQGTREALLGAKELAKAGFGLEFRVAMVPVHDVYAANMWLSIGKYRHSEKITQTTLGGFGWNWAEGVIKDPQTKSRYEITGESGTKANADFTGFECRWRPIAARHDFKLAMIAQSTSRDSTEHAALYDELLLKMTEIYGDVIDYHPLFAGGLGLTFSPKRLWGEATVRAHGKGPIYFFGHLVLLLTISAFASLLFKFNLKAAGVRWGGYKREVVDNADFRKFDGALKMVVDSTEKQESELKAYLESCRANGRLIYGLNRSSHAIMTCLVFTAGRDHAHFVDGSEGGYAMAAKQLKQQLTQLKAERAA